MSVVVMSAMAVTLFLGGPSGPTFGLPDPIASLLPTVWFTLKVLVFVFLFILLRGALPRTRYHRLMDLGWKVLIPVGFVWVMVSAAFVVIGEGGGLTPTVRTALVAIAAVVVVAALVPGLARGSRSEREGGRGDGEGAVVGRAAPAEEDAVQEVDA
jgi:NADH-quinone oxidoreductase subunit H